MLHSSMSLEHIGPVYPDPVQLQVYLLMPSIQEPPPQGEAAHSSISILQVFPLNPIQTQLNIIRNTICILLQQYLSGSHFRRLVPVLSRTRLNVYSRQNLSVSRSSSSCFARLCCQLPYPYCQVRSCCPSPFVFRIFVLLPFARIILVIYRLLQCIYLFLFQKPLVMI